MHDIVTYHRDANFDVCRYNVCARARVTVCVYVCVYVCVCVCVCNHHVSGEGKHLYIHFYACVRRLTVRFT
jgi:hypothetical protein